MFILLLELIFELNKLIVKLSWSSRWNWPSSVFDISAISIICGVNILSVVIIVHGDFSV
jgi:hypothetical protein